MSENQNDQNSPGAYDAQREDVEAGFEKSYEHGYEEPLLTFDELNAVMEENERERETSPPSESNPH